MLTDKFSDYQILLLTHEKEFFELVSSEVKNKGWLIQNFKWSKDKGIDIEKGIFDIKERILEKLKAKDSEGLGNDIRIYTEKAMKEIALNVEARVAFRYNELNEKRMAPELLDAIQSKLAKSSEELKEITDIPRVKGMPMFVANITSHDNEFQESIEDLEVMWEYIKKLIDTFHCNSCNKPISMKHFDNVENKIRCGCGELSYDWRN